MDIKLQTVINSIGSLVLLGGQWVISVSLVHTCGYDDTGIFSLAMTIANVFSTIANYGLRNYQITDFTRVNHQRQYFLMRIISGVIVIFLCIIYLHMNKKYNQDEILAVILYLLYNISIVLSDSILTSVQLKKHLECNGYSNILRGILCVAFFVVTLFILKDLVISLGMMSLASFLVFICYDMTQYKRFCHSEKESIFKSFQGAIKLYFEGFPIMISTIIPMIITAYPRTVLRHLLGTEALGYFSVVYTPAVILSTVIPPTLIAFLPQISETWSKNNLKRLIKCILISYGTAICISIIALLGSLLCGRFVLGILYGSSITAYVYLLYYSILAVGMSCVCICGHNILIAIGEKRISAQLSIFTLVLTLLISNKIIYNFGIGGTVYVQMIVFSLQAILELLYLFKTIGKKHGRIELYD